PLGAYKPQSSTISARFGSAPADILQDLDRFLQRHAQPALELETQAVEEGVTDGVKKLVHDSRIHECHRQVWPQLAQGLDHLVDGVVFRDDVVDWLSNWSLGSMNRSGAVLRQTSYRFHQPDPITLQIRPTSSTDILVCKGKTKYFSSIASMFGKPTCRPPKTE